ncbi:MAG: hypothetical protein IKW97_02850 [Muribaculaceae bacterium]|nr:hypothetical protein [Muribaculaceae bacterium]
MSIKSKEEIEAVKTQSKLELQNLYHLIENSTERLVPLYGVIENYFFQDIDIQKLKPLIPLWMVDAGHSPESLVSKNCFDKLRQVYSDSLANRIIHWSDVQLLLGALQDRLMAVKNHLIQFYQYLPCYCLYDDNDYESSKRILDNSSDIVHAAANNVFVSLNSSFDLLTKIVYECSHYDATGFDKYKKMKSRKKSALYNKGNYGFDELKTDGLLYSEPVCIRTVCSFRDEFLHNGAWDYRCAIYYPIIAGEHVEPFVVMPDIDEKGVLVSSGSRNKFYIGRKKLNVEFPRLVTDVFLVLDRTITTFHDVLTRKTVTKDKGFATRAALRILQHNQEILNGYYQR